MKKYLFIVLSVLLLLRGCGDTASDNVSESEELSCSAIGRYSLVPILLLKIGNLKSSADAWGFFLCLILYFLSLAHRCTMNVCLL